MDALGKLRLLVTWIPWFFWNKRRVTTKSGLWNSFIIISTFSKRPRKQRPVQEKYSPARGWLGFRAHSTQRGHRVPKTLQETGTRPCPVALWSGTCWSLTSWHLQGASSVKRRFHLFTLHLHSCLCFPSIALNCPVCIASFVLIVSF